MISLNACSYCEENPKPDMPSIHFTHDRNWIQVADPNVSSIFLNNISYKKYISDSVLSDCNYPKFFSKNDLDSFLYSHLKDSWPVSKSRDSIDFNKYFAVVFKLKDFTCDEFRMSSWLNTREKIMEYYIDMLVNTCRYNYHSNQVHPPAMVFVRYYEKSYSDLCFKMKYKTYGY
ncbi:MAG: hypothetical protein KG003_02460 [Bacteroidetes bacterium]|nr:hypothetical protein [Bacteroidota bacterium]